MRSDEESRDWIYYGLREVMYMDIRWKESEDVFIKRAKMNTSFLFDAARDYRRARIVSSVDTRGPQTISLELERDILNIEVFQSYFDGWYGDYSKFFKSIIR